MLLRRLVTSILILAVVLTAPGSLVYEALAQSLSSSGLRVQPRAQGLRAAPMSVLGASLISGPLSGLGSLIPPNRSLVSPVAGPAQARLAAPNALTALGEAVAPPRALATALSAEAVPAGLAAAPFSTQGFARPPEKQGAPTPLSALSAASDGLKRSWNSLPALQGRLGGLYEGQQLSGTSPESPLDPAELTEFFTDASAVREFVGLKPEDRITEYRNKPIPDPFSFGKRGPVRPVYRHEIAVNGGGRIAFYTKHYEFSSWVPLFLPPSLRLDALNVYIPFLGKIINRLRFRKQLQEEARISNLAFERDVGPKATTFTAHGRTLLLQREALGQNLKQARPGSPEDVRSLAYALGQALSWLHQNGVTHAHLAEPHLFWEKEGSGRIRVQLIDFGHTGKKTVTDDRTEAIGLLGRFLYPQLPVHEIGRALDEGYRSLLSQQTSKKFEELTQRLRLVEDSYFSGSKDAPRASEPEQALVEAKAIALGLLAQLRRAAEEPKPARGIKALVEAGLTWALGELREKLDVRETFRKIGRFILTEGFYFGLYWGALELVEFFLMPTLIGWLTHPALFWLGWFVHLEPITIPLYFVIRTFLWRWKLWRGAGGRRHYKELKDFRARLMDEDPGRRIEKIFLKGLPFPAGGGAVMVNVNRSKLPVWIPLWLRNIYEYDFRWYDLYISINELVTLAPKPIVRQLRGYYKEYPRAVSYLLAQAILEGAEEAKARFIQNLSFKYWLNLGFDNLQPTLLHFLGEGEQQLEKANREFAGQFFIPATPEERRMIRTMVSDIYSAVGILQTRRIDARNLLDVMAPFFPNSYPKGKLTRRALLASSEALVRARFLIEYLARRGRLPEGETIDLDGEPIAVLVDGKPQYVGKAAPAMEVALKRYESSFNGAMTYLERYGREVRPEVFESGEALREDLGFANEIPPYKPQLLHKIYWLKQVLIPRQIDALMKTLEETSSHLDTRKRRRRYRRNMMEQIQQLKGLQKRLEQLEFAWLKAYYAQRFVQEEKEVSAYPAILAQTQELEGFAQTAGAIGNSLSRQALANPS